MSGLLALALALSSTIDPVIDPAPPTRDGAELSPDITVSALKAHVYLLASPDFLGRRGAGAARASRYVADAFERLHLQPAFDGSFFQPIPWLVDERKGSFIGRNVGAILPGTDPTLKDEWILLCAHYDHLGVRGSVLYPGADDNASGVAMLLEVARRFTLLKAKPRRSVMFVAFDQEEAGLLGSRHFICHPPRSVKKLKACLTADMLGRSMANVMDEFVFVLGSENSPRLRQLLSEVKPEEGLRVGRVGADLIGTRSDYGPFRDRRVPFLFLSTGQHPDYHQPTDLPDRVDYVKLRRVSLWISDLLGRLAGDTQVPEWNDDGLGPDLEEARTVQILLARVLDRPRTFPLTPGQRDLAKGAGERLENMVAQGQVTASDRTWLVWTTRLLMVVIF